MPVLRGRQYAHYFDKIRHYVNCPDCGESSQSRLSKDDAIAIWNTRPREEELLEIIKLVRRVVELGNSDEAALEWMQANTELCSKADDILKKYEVKNE